jgi:hypothetical protein
MVTIRIKLYSLQHKIHRFVHEEQIRCVLDLRLGFAITSTTLQHLFVWF